MLVEQRHALRLRHQQACQQAANEPCSVLGLDASRPLERVIVASEQVNADLERGLKASRTANEHFAKTPSSYRLNSTMSSLRTEGEDWPRQARLVPCSARLHGMPGSHATPCGP
jgi:hypothetical protein